MRDPQLRARYSRTPQPQLHLDGRSCRDRDPPARLMTSCARRFPQCTAPCGAVRAIESCHFVGGYDALLGITPGEFDESGICACQPEADQPPDVPDEGESRRHGEESADE